MIASVTGTIHCSCARALREYLIVSGPFETVAGRQIEVLREKGLRVGDIVGRRVTLVREIDVHVARKRTVVVADHLGQISHPHIGDLAQRDGGAG